MSLKIRTFDITLVIIPLIFLAVSVAVIYSLVSGTVNQELGYKQLAVGLVSFLIMLGVSFIDYRFFKGTAWLFYLASIFLLILVELFGKTVKGAQNWLELGFFQLQPSEIAKIFLIFSLSSFLSGKIGKLRYRDILFSFLLIIPPLFLIIKEPDLGTALVIIFVYLVLVFVAKPSKIQSLSIIGIITLVAAFAVLAYVRIPPFSGFLKDYQRQRIAVFLNPKLEPYKQGYNVQQAQITIGSGGIIGKGLGKGSQSQLQFLPEAHTDFIIAGIGESFGFVGIFVLLSLYTFLIIRLFDIAQIARDNFGMIVTTGIAAMILIQTLVNVGMNMGLMPVTGITLPFLSSGGTSLLVSLFSLGIAQSIYIRHKKISF